MSSRCREGWHRKERSLTSNESDLRARARAVDPTNKLARIRFISTLSGEFERGETTAILADVWGLNQSTVTRDACDAVLHAKLASDTQPLAEMFIGEMLEQLRETKDELAATQAALSSMSFDRPRDVKEGAEAIKATRDQVMKLVELLGKASGVISSGSATTVNVLVDATGAPKGVLADIAAALVSFAQSNQEVAGALADSLRGIGGPALRPATDTIARQIAEHAVDTVEAMPEWMSALSGQERHACESVWWTLPDGERNADVTRVRLAEVAGELVGRVRR